VNILIAEDNVTIQKIHRWLMNTWGYKFDLASNGMEALEFAKKNNGKYDLCLMDVEMPEMSGIEATKLIRQNVRYFPIIGFTSNSSYETACYDAGMDDFAVKPCLPDDLYEKINKLSVKVYKFMASPHGFDIDEENPVDQQHAEELKKLKSQGLIKMRLDGPDDREVIAHKNTPNKISYDFNVLKHSMTEFLNRDPERPTVCDLYRGSKNCIVETFVDENDYRDILKAEDEMMEKFQTKYYRTDEE
jgi:CheY-like chemotaxis protein